MLSYLQTLFSEPLAFFDQAIFRVLAVLIGLCCHEWGHAFVAYRCGDDTAKRAGRLTLNPLAHLDPLGALLMFFAGFGWAKPVPVNPWNFRGDRTRADLKVSLAGIAVNMILFVGFTYLSVLFSAFMWRADVVAEVGLSTVVSYRYNAVWAVIGGTAAQEFGDLIAGSWAVPFVRLFAYTALVNLNLAVFNLIPLPPLDGYHVVNDLVFKGRFQLSQNAFRIGMLIVLVLSAQGILGRIISAVVYPVQGLLLAPIRMIWG
ncbi:MAG: site-2 protease family protein [Clostridia bacterium]|nr:site-2 protease family protein [Clostridia bacterium]